MTILFYHKIVGINLMNASQISATLTLQLKLYLPFSCAQKYAHNPTNIRTIIVHNSQLDILDSYVILAKVVVFCYCIY